MKLNPELYRIAAEFNFLRSQGLQADPSELASVGRLSKFSCDNLLEAASVIEPIKSMEDLATYGQHRALYGQYFKPNTFELGWWPLIDGDWDYESRILALLLMAEIAEDEQVEA